MFTVHLKKTWIHDDRALHALFFGFDQSFEGKARFAGRSTERGGFYV